MIFIDEGQLKYTPDLHHMFGSIPCVPVQQDDDLIFHGYGTTSICMEIKKVGTDLMHSVINGHLAAQLRRARANHTIAMLGTYGELDRNPSNGEARQRIYLRGGKSQLVAISDNAKLHIQYSRITHTIFTQIVKDGVIWVKGQHLKDLCDQIAEWYHWWQTPMEEHKSDETPYSSAYLSGSIPLTVRVAKELPNVGIKRAQAAGDHFSSVQDMVDAEWSEWHKVPGIGEMTAKAIVLSPGWKREGEWIR